jgi:hypothetical protein
VLEEPRVELLFANTFLRDAAIEFLHLRFYRGSQLRARPPIKMLSFRTPSTVKFIRKNVPKTYSLFKRLQRRPNVALETTEKVYPHPMHNLLRQYSKNYEISQSQDPNEEKTHNKE